MSPAAVHGTDEARMTDVRLLHGVTVPSGDYVNVYSMFSQLMCVTPENQRTPAILNRAVEFAQGTLARWEQELDLVGIVQPNGSK